MTIDEIIRIRKSYKLSQRAFARLIGVGSATIARYELGNAHLSQDTLLIYRLLQDNPDFIHMLWRINGDNLTEKEKLKSNIQPQEQKEELRVKPTMFKQHEELLESINFVHDKIHEALFVLETQQAQQSEPSFVDTAILELKEAIERMGY